MLATTKKGRHFPLLFTPNREKKPSNISSTNKAQLTQNQATIMNTNKKLEKLPEDVKSISVTGAFVEIECGVDYYGSDDGYNRLATIILKIIDLDGRTIPEIWEKSWTEVAPGITTRRLEGSARSGRREQAKQQSLRIYRSACPVYVLIRHTHEYVSYDEPGSQSSYDEWFRYEASNSDR
jgi:hypothetical protein